MKLNYAHPVMSKVEYLRRFITPLEIMKTNTICETVFNTLGIGQEWTFLKEGKQMRGILWLS